MDPMHYARVKFYDLLDSNFPVEYGEALSIKRENQKFEQPVDEPFLATYMINTQSKRASIGTLTKFQYHEGFFCIECQVPAESGMGSLWRMAGAAARVLEELQTQLDNGDWLYTDTAKSVGNTSQDANYFVTVMIPFCVYTCAGQF